MNEEDIAHVGPQRHKGENCTNSGNIFTVQKQIVRNMAVAQPRAPCRSPFKQLETPPVACMYILSLVDFIIDNQEIFQILLYTKLIQGIRTILTDQMPNCHVFKKVHSMLA
jgi:hypothetical protein